jgi:hypothetical protein
MDRREFVKGGALAVVGTALANRTASAVSSRQFVLENAQIAWHLESTEKGIRSVSLENRLSGRKFPLQVSDEFTLTFAAGQRVEIPWWNFSLTDDGAVAAEEESGLAKGFHKGQGDPSAWKPVKNLAGGGKGRHYDGYGWFRQEFELQEAAKGRDIVFMLGGYDQLDWNERWVYVNGQAIGHSSAAGRWRTPGRYVVRPSDPAYPSLNFGQTKNLVAVRAKQYNFNFPGVPDKVLDRIVFHPWLFDQFISVGEPYLPVSTFHLRDVHQQGPEKIDFVLRNAEHQVDVIAHYELEGFVRRKWLEIKNNSRQAQMLLDMEVDAYQLQGDATGGGQGAPIFLENQAFLGLDHPAAVNQSSDGTIRMWHCPGRMLQPGSSWKSQTSLVGVSPSDGALDQFHRYILSRSPRMQKKQISIYTCYGINNQWGGCPALTDEEVLNSLNVVKGWQKKGVKFDFFTLDQGWPNNDGDLTEFANTCYPDGPAKIIEGIQELGMKFGLWFSVSGGGWSDGSYPAVQTSAIPEPGGSGDAPTLPPVGAYRNGYPVGLGLGRNLCIASDPYFNVFRNAVQHHVRDNKLRLVKLDIGDYYCNSTSHQHLPGKYSSEAMFDRLIDIANSARAIAPDVFIVWYWGVGDSPFWALYGDTIFESGLFLEGSGTSWVPSLYYRDSVTLALDQSTRFAKPIPPLLKDSLGVWLSQIRWANFMGKHRWREAMVMDLGRGNLMFPQIWGDPNLLNDDDLKFLSEMIALSRDNESIFLRPRRDVGDIFKNEPYAYAFCENDRGLIFCNNVHFESRSLKLPLGKELGLVSAEGSPLQLRTHFPEKATLQPVNGGDFQAGSTAEVWLRPFETLLLEVGSKAASLGELPPRAITATSARQHGLRLELKDTGSAPWMELRFADAARFEKVGMRPGVQRFSVRLPRFDGRSVVAIHVRLKKGDAEYRYSPYVAELVQIRARVGDRNLPLNPVPDARQYGNTQNAGCSWVVYKSPLSAEHADQDFDFAVHTFLPAEVEAVVEAWLVKLWWNEETRPEADGYYGDAPS